MRIEVDQEIEKKLDAVKTKKWRCISQLMDNLRQQDFRVNTNLNHSPANYQLRGSHEKANQRTIWNYGKNN